MIDPPPPPPPPAADHDQAGRREQQQQEGGGGEEDEPLTESQQADELAFQQVCCDARCRSGTGFWRQHCYLTLRW